MVEMAAVQRQAQAKRREGPKGPVPSAPTAVASSPRTESSFGSKDKCSNPADQPQLLLINQGTHSDGSFMTFICASSISTLDSICQKMPAVLTAADK